MIPSSFRAKLLAVGAAFVAHSVMSVALTSGSKAEMEGSAGAAEARLGSSFTDMVAGTLSSTATEEVLDAAQPERTETERPKQQAEAQKGEVERRASAKRVDQSLPVAERSVEPPVETAAVAPPAPERVTSSTDKTPSRIEAPQPKEARPATQADAPVRDPAPADDPTETETARKAEPVEQAPKQEETAGIAAPARRPDDLKPPEPVEKPSSAPRGNAVQSARAGETTGRERATATRSGTVGSTREAGNAAASNYPGEVMRKLSRVRRPRFNATGATIVTFRVSASGSLAGLSVAQSSGSAKLDNAALRVVRLAAPFPAPPPGAQRTFNFKVTGQ